MIKQLSEETFEDLLFTLNKYETIKEVYELYGFDDSLDFVKALLMHSYYMGWGDCEDEAQKRILA